MPRLSALKMTRRQKSHDPICPGRFPHPTPKAPKSAVPPPPSRRPAEGTDGISPWTACRWPLTAAALLGLTSPGTPEAVGAPTSHSPGQTSVLQPSSSELRRCKPGVYVDPNLLGGAGWLWINTELISRHRELFLLSQCLWCREPCWT